MVYFTDIKKTKHYEEEHEQNVPWSEVVDVIFKSDKNQRFLDVLKIFDFPDIKKYKEERGKI